MRARCVSIRHQRALCRFRHSALIDLRRDATRGAPSVKQTSTTVHVHGHRNPPRAFQYHSVLNACASSCDEICRRLLAVGLCLHLSPLKTSSYSLGFERAYSQRFTRCFRNCRIPIGWGEVQISRVCALTEFISLRESPRKQLLSVVVGPELCR